MPDYQERHGEKNDAGNEPPALSEQIESASVKPPHANAAAPIINEETCDSCASKDVCGKPARLSEDALIDRINKSDRWMIGLTFAIVFFAAVSAWITHGQLEEMKASGEDTKLLIKAAQDSAKAAQDALRIASENTQRQLRAYVFVENVSAVLEDKTLKVIMEIKNFGHTPAYDLSLKIFIRTGVVGIKTNLHTGEADPAGKSITIIGPGGSSTIRTELPIPPESAAVITALQGGIVAPYLDGQIDYRDGFGDKWVVTSSKWKRDKSAALAGLSMLQKKEMRKSGSRNTASEVIA